jgi:hypothetical protein
MNFVSYLKRNRLVILVLLVCVLGRLFISPYPFDEKIIRGGDSQAHTHIIQMVKDYGPIGWDRFWNAGQTFLRFYPPMTYAIAAALPFSDVVSFKLSFLAFFLITPMAFYLFAKELKLSNKELLLSTIIFSFTMHFSYLFDMGSFPSSVALPFGLIFLKYFIRLLKTSDMKYAAISSVFWGINLLAHNIIALMFGLFAAVYLAVTYFSKPDRMKISQSLFVLICGVLISSVWIFPFVVENPYFGLGKIPEENLSLLLMPFTIVYRLFGFYVNGVSTFLGGAAAVLILTGFISLVRNKDATSRFLIWTTIASLAIYLYTGFTGSLIPINRSLILFSVPFAILIAKNINFNRLKYLMFVFVAVEVAYFLLTPVQTDSTYLNYTSAFSLINGTGRAVLEPEFNNIIYTAPKAGLEVGNGEYDYSTPKEHFSFLNGRKLIINCWGQRPLLQRLFSLDGVFQRESIIVQQKCELIHSDYEEYFRLLDVQYVIADNRPGVYPIFDNDPVFEKIKDFGSFFLYKFKNANFIKTEVDSSYSVMGGAIKIDLSSDTRRENISVWISESWYPYWRANDSSIKLVSDKNGFITFNVPEINGQKSIMLEFKNPSYYDYFAVVSAFGLIVSFAPLVFRKK